jgi:hypothetical protein
MGDHCAFFCLFATQSQAQSYCYVERIVDGDTVVLVVLNKNIDGKVKSVIRMSNIDAPELHRSLVQKLQRHLTRNVPDNICGWRLGKLRSTGEHWEHCTTGKILTCGWLNRVLLIRTKERLNITLKQLGMRLSSVRECGQVISLLILLYIVKISRLRA